MYSFNGGYIKFVTKMAPGKDKKSSYYAKKLFP